MKERMTSAGQEQIVEDLLCEVEQLKGEARRYRVQLRQMADALVEGATRRESQRETARSRTKSSCPTSADLVELGDALQDVQRKIARRESELDHLGFRSPSPTKLSPEPPR